MARPSLLNSFGGSSLGRFNQQQGAGALPSAYERLQWGNNPGSDLYNAQQAQAPWSMGLSDRAAKPVGRSMYDPTRLAEQALRSTADPFQRLQAGIIRSNLMPQEQPDELNQIVNNQVAQENNGSPNYIADQLNKPSKPKSNSGYLGRFFNGMGRNVVNNAMNQNSKFSPIFLR